MPENLSLEKFTIRQANENDAELLYNFILEMAHYEKELEYVTTTVQSIKDTICKKHFAEGLIGEYDGVPMAYAVYYFTYSTYVGKPSIYLEDLYVKPEYRGCGVGKKMFSYLAKYALECGCGRFDWSCLDWNVNSIKFYLSLGAEVQEDRTIYRLHGKTLLDMAQKY